MKYVTAVKFRDLQDNDHIYQAGEPYPRKGVTATEERINQLLTGNNPSGLKLIVAVEEPKKTPRKDRKTTK